MIIAGIIEQAKDLGAWPGQAVLMAGIIALGWVIRRIYIDTNSEIACLVKRLDTREEMMNQERRDRINMLMKVLSEDSGAKRDVAHALENNTKAIQKLESMLERYFQPLR